MDSKTVKLNCLSHLFKNQTTLFALYVNVKLTAYESLFILNTTYFFTVFKGFILRIKCVVTFLNIAVEIISVAMTENLLVMGKHAIYLSTWWLLVFVWIEIEVL